jgi:phosphoribosylformylglycinamidine cyclo-ligase
VFSELQRQGGISDDEMARTFNLGIGMVLAVDPATAGVVVETLEEGGIDAAAAGVVRDVRAA